MLIDYMSVVILQHKLSALLPIYSLAEKYQMAFVFISRQPNAKI